MSGQRGAVIVIGLGNELRGDDAAGLEVVRRLGAPRGGFACAPYEGESSGLLELWRDASAVVLVDALRTGAAPGTVHRLDASHAPLRSSLRSGSSHAVGVGEAIELGRALGRLPPRVVIYGVEADGFEAGGELSERVAAAIEPLTEAVRREAESLAEVSAKTNG